MTAQQKRTCLAGYVPYEGDCAEASLRYMLGKLYANDPNIWKYRLVHAIVRHSVTDEKMFHAWVELGDTVIDQSNGRHQVRNRIDYYRAARLHAGDLRRYAIQAVIKNMELEDTYGPWQARFKRWTTQ